MDWQSLKDPFKLKELLWPQYKFYTQQVEIVRSVWDNYKTVVPAGHKLGKDFITGFIAPAFFLTRHPCRVVTTSVDGSQLQAVLWGEIGRFIQESVVPLDVERGGPLILNHLHIRKMWHGQVDKLSYMIGRVAAKGEGLSGHHIAKQRHDDVFTLAIIDEASGVGQQVFEKMAEWAHRILIIGNPYDCANEFKWSVKGYPGGKDGGGDLPRIDGPGFERKVIRIKAEDSPNVRFALAEKAAGRKVSHTMLVPGVQPYEDYLQCRRSWDPIKQCVGLDADFYEGAELRLYPAEVLNKCETYAQELANSNLRRVAKAIGCDPGEGGAETAWYVIDELGIIDERVLLTPDTSVITEVSAGLVRQHNLPGEMLMFDKGGGGRQIADALRKRGVRARTVGFGETVTPILRARSIVSLKRKVEETEQRTTYVSRRAQMFHQLSLRLCYGAPFAIPAKYTELRRQLSPMPLKYDDEGRIRLPPKGGNSDKKYTEKTLVEILGCSPDRADALVVAYHSMVTPTGRARAGARMA